MVAKLLDVTETAIRIVDWWKNVWATYRFVPKCNHTQGSHTSQYFHFFSHVCRITVCWDPAVVMDPPEILLPWQSETTPHLCISIEVFYGSLFSREELSVKTRIAWSVVVTKQDGHVFCQLRTKIIVLQCLTERKKGVKFRILSTLAFWR